MRLDLRQGAVADRGGDRRGGGGHRLFLELARFRLAFPKPPAAASGEVYKTLDARCVACEVMGGDEPPCQPASLLRVIEEKTGFPCPRRESLNADDDLCMELLTLMVSPRLASLAIPWAELLLVGLEADHRLRLLRRVAAAFGDEQISKLVPLVPRLF